MPDQIIPVNFIQYAADILGDTTEGLNHQKRGLMQKLLAGEWRVKGATELEAVG